MPATAQSGAAATPKQHHGLDGAADSRDASEMSKEERKKAKKERKAEKKERQRKGYLTPRDVVSSDPVKQFTTLS